MTKDDRQAFEVPDRLFEYVRSVVDNRALATVLLFLLSLLLIGIDNIVGILAVLLVGFLLIDRFEIVCRCVVIGGAAWAMTLAIGAMALGGIVMSERHADGRRFVSSYSGVRRAASGGVELERYVTFDAAERTWTLDREPPFIAEGLRSGTLTQEEVDEWRSLCPSS